MSAFGASLGAILMATGVAAQSAPGQITAPEHSGPTEANVSTISATELRVRLDWGNVRLIDVRTAEEVAEGMIPGAEHIPLDQFHPAALDLSDGREVIIYCRSSRRSQIAAERFAAHTGRPAIHLEGGINAWVDAGGAIEIQR